MDTPKQIGRYEILAELGQGAMGTVYRAKDPAMDREVALKTIISLVLASDKGGEFRERFYREARASGKLAHPGIVAVFDVGEHEGLPFLVMEFVSGRTLADAAKQGERFTLDRICELGQQLAEALGHAHRAGVVHRDIKPANILLTSREVYGIERPKITDFGVAKLAAGHTTMTGQILGTPAFMPPEQFTGSPIDGRADLFSLGVVLYLLATGEQPFPGEGITAVSYKVVHTDPVPPRKLNPSIPAKFEAIVMKCLAKSPDERYQSGEELAHDLAAFRTTGAASALRTAAPQAPLPGSDSEATFVETPAALRAGLPPAANAPPTVDSQVASAPAARANVGAKSKLSRNLVFVGVAAVVILILVLVVALRRHPQPTKEAALQTSAAATGTESSPADSAPTPGAGPGSGVDSGAAPEIGAGSPSGTVGSATTASAAATPSNTKKPTASAVSNAPASKSAAVAAKNAPANAKASDVAANASDSTAPSAPPPPAIPAPAAIASSPPAAIDFDPKTLDPKQNARLKIEADQWPAGLDFAVEMNGKIYLRRSVAGEQKDYDNLFVPPGVQEFRVTASSGGVEKASLKHCKLPSSRQKKTP